MSGTKAGGAKAAATNKRLHGADFYREIGRKGGKNGHTGGFAANPELAKIAGSIGGRISRRGPAKRNADGTIKHNKNYELDQYEAKYGGSEHGD